MNERESTTLTGTTARAGIRVTMTRDLYRAISKAAKDEDRSIAQWIRRACQRTLVQERHTEKSE